MNAMTNQRRFCTQNFKVWVAFLMGMVTIVIAIVVFDRVLGIGGLTAPPRPEEPAAPAVQPAAGTTAAGTAGQTFLSLTSTSKSPSAWIGIDAADLSKTAADRLGLDIDGGVLVSRVVPGSPAAADGLLRGDIIFSIDHRKVTSVDDLVKALGKLDPGDRVRVAVIRDDEREVIYVKLGEAPVEALPAVRTVAGEVIPSEQKWGIAVSELTPSLRAAYEIPKRETGVVIVMVVPNSAAQRAGLRNGDLIKQVDRETVENMADLFAALKDTSRHVMLKIYRNGSEIFVHVIAVSPMTPTGGGSESEDDEDEEVKGYKEQPDPLPPMGKPGSTSSLTPATTAAQQPINLASTKTSTKTNDTKTNDTKTNDDQERDHERDRDEEKPVCKRVQDLDPDRML